jgi:uncharacterized protein (DUF302 family)
LHQNDHKQDEVVMKLMVWTFVALMSLLQVACVATQGALMEQGTAIYEVAVAPGVSYEDVVDSLKINAEGANFVNPANFPLGEHLKLRGQAPEGPLEVRAFCNLSLGAEIMLDHPEFAVFAPCRIAIYQKQGQLFLGLDRPTFDLKSIKNPSERAKKAAQVLEDELISLMKKASKGDF